MADSFVPLSVKGSVLLALKTLIQDLELDGLEDSEIEVREDWKASDGQPYRGASIFDLGETYTGGTIGTQDVGYLVGVVFAQFRTYDAMLSDDRIQAWYEAVRRRIMDQRPIDSINHPSGPREIIFKMLPGRSLTNPAQYPNWKLRMLVTAGWQRESQTLSVT